MIISDLQHLEIVSEETSIVGGTSYDCGCYVPKKPKHNKAPKLTPKAAATADADALAVGIRTFTDTNTDVQAVAGSFSQSHSDSTAIAVGSKS